MQVKIETHEGEKRTFENLANVYQDEKGQLFLEEEGDVMVDEALLAEYRKAKVPPADLPEPGSVVKGMGIRACFTVGAWANYEVTSR